MGSLSLDHVIIVVSDLGLAADQFKLAGFSVQPGGVHTGNLTHNALIPFADGTYLELLATTRRSSFRVFKLLKKLRLLDNFTRGKTEINRRIIENIASDVGINDFALFSPDLIHEISLVRKAGLEICDPIPGGRVRPDGQQVSWRTAVPNLEELPFLIDDLTPRELRNPTVSDEFHANRICGIHGISILVSSIVDSTTHYQSLLGKSPSSEVKFSQPGTQNIQFNFEDKFISLAGILPGTSGLQKYLARRPSKPLGLFFQTKDGKPTNILSFTYTQDHGVNLSKSHRFI